MLIVDTAGRLAIDEVLMEEIKSLHAALDPADQKAQAGAIQTLLLDETPVIFPYFYDYLSATVPNLQGVETTAMGQIFLHKASYT